MISFNSGGTQAQQSLGSMGVYSELPPSRSVSANVVQRRKLSIRGKLVATINGLQSRPQFFMMLYIVLANHKEDAGMTPPYYHVYQNHCKLELYKMSHIHKPWASLCENCVGMKLEWGRNEMLQMGMDKIIANQNP